MGSSNERYPGTVRRERWVPSHLANPGADANPGDGGDECVGSGHARCGHPSSDDAVSLSDSPARTQGHLSADSGEVGNQLRPPPVHSVIGPGGNDGCGPRLEKEAATVNPMV